MAYSTLSDIQEQLSDDKLVDLTQDDPAISSIDTSKVDRAIADADEEIESYCAKKYAIPFSTTPDLVRKLSVDIAVYNLYARRGDAPDFRKERYKNAVKLLEKISTGMVTLGVTPAPSENSSQAAYSSTKDRVFSRESMKGF